VPYLSASAVVIHYEEALYQVFAALPLTIITIEGKCTLCRCISTPSCYVVGVNKYWQCKSIVFCLFSFFSVICVYCTGRANKKYPPTILPITHQRFKIILQYFVGVLTVYIDIYLLSYISLILVMRKIL